MPERVIFFFEDKVRRVGHARVHLFLNLLLALAEQEELETTRAQLAAALPMHASREKERKRAT